MRDLLIRYLLGELDYREQQQLESKLHGSPELRRELAYLQSCFSAADGGENFASEPPRGLAERTTQRIADSGDELLSLRSGGSASHAVALADSTAARPTWSLADMTVATGVFLAISMLVMPALRDSRDASRRRDCQNNLRQVGILLAHYASNHGGYLPQAGPGENAGIYTVRLVESGLAGQDGLASLLECRGPTPAGPDGAPALPRIPTAAELAAMAPAQLAEARREMSRMYAYRLGYWVGPRYMYVRHRSDPYSPVMADAPSHELEGRMSPNHGGNIVQVLYDDGSVRPQRSSTVHGRDDDLFTNAQGLEAAGLGPGDAVLGRSEAIPALPAGGTPPAARIQVRFFVSPQPQ